MSSQDYPGRETAHVDLTDEGGPVVPVDLTVVEADAPPPGVDIRVIEADRFKRQILARQEFVRTALAVGAFLSLVVILLVILVSVFASVTAENMEKVAVVVVTPLTGIVGTIVGFYFAEKKDGNGTG